MSRHRGGKVVIIKKKRSPTRGGVIAGSWKVAYADFVTALMAFFLVMWIVGMDLHTRQAIEGYFSNPIGFRKGYAAGLRPIASGGAGSDAATHQPAALRVADRLAEQRSMERTSAAIRDAIDRSGALGGAAGLGGRVELALVSDGLRVELVEGAQGETFFSAGTALTPRADSTLALVARVLAGLSSAVIIEGHTDAQRPAGTHSNWELSAERADAARRVLEANGLAPDRILEVRALADRKLRLPDHPLDPSNRRVSILIPFRTPAGRVGA